LPKIVKKRLDKEQKICYLYKLGQVGDGGRRRGRAVAVTGAWLKKK
jgi:hypothetical protein